MKFLSLLIPFYLFQVLPAVKDPKTNKTEDYAFADNKERVLELYLPFRLDFYAEMKLTSIFPRKFLYTLRDYKKTKEAGKPIISMPNYAAGAIHLGAVHIPNRRVLIKFFELLNDLTKRVFRTGLNEQTIGGNFRLPMVGMGIEEDTRHVYARFDKKYPTDSYARYITFMKSLYYRLSRLNIRYEIYGEMKLDQFVLGRVEDLSDIDMDAFDREFGNFMVGFVVFSKLLVIPPNNTNDSMRSIFYFDHTSHEPIIGIENTYEGDSFEGGINGKGTKQSIFNKQDGKGADKPQENDVPKKKSEKKSNIKAIPKVNSKSKSKTSTDTKLKSKDKSKSKSK